MNNTSPQPQFAHTIRIEIESNLSIEIVNKFEYNEESERAEDKVESKILLSFE